MITPAQEQVRQFTLGLKGPGQNRISEAPGVWLDEKTKELCKKLIVEEYDELIKAIDADDWVEMIDGSADLIYVVLFLCVKAGIDLTDYWDEVVRTNMAKLGGPVHPETGKQLKPEGWKPPQIREIFETSRARFRAMSECGAVGNSHFLKTALQPFDAVWKGQKKHEWRKHDRFFNVGEFLVLREYDTDPGGTYTGREIIAEITYMTTEFDMASYQPFEVNKHPNQTVVLTIKPLATIDQDNVTVAGDPTWAPANW